MKWCMLLLLPCARGRTRHGFRNTTRAVRLPVDAARQRSAALDVALGAVEKKLAAYDPARVCKDSVVAKGRARGSHERNQDGLGAQVFRADQLAPLLLAHALTGLRIACRPHEWNFGDAYGEEGAMAIFGCGRGADGRTRGAGVFAASAALDRLAGTYARRRLIDDALRGAFLAAAPLLRPARGGETPRIHFCAARVYVVGIDEDLWMADAMTLVGAAAAHSFGLARTVLRPQFELVRAARPRPLDVWGGATVRVALHVRRGDVMPVKDADRGAGEGAAWGLPLKGTCKAVELAAFWPCVAAYLERRANETARVVVVSTAGRADLPGADGAPVADVAYLADRPPPPRATPRSNTHVDALARDLDVMASATALFFSPGSSVAVLGAALASDGTDFLEVFSRAPGCDAQPRAPPSKIPLVPGAQRC